MSHHLTGKCHYRSMPGQVEVEPNLDAYEPRARIVNGETGEVRPVLKDQLTGLDEFIGAWKQNVDLPEELMFTAWQMSDEAHPAGEGKPAYRLVYKTLRTVPFPQVSLIHPNLRVNFANGPVTLGEPRFAEALSRRKTGSFMIPEWGSIEEGAEGGAGYAFQQNVNIQMEAHQETTPSANYLEILYALPAGDWVRYDQMVAAGRAGIASLTAMLDLIYGERLLGPVLTEEAGEVFDDWHWNRRIGGRTISMESQARLEMVDGNVFVARLSQAIAGQLELSPEARNRIRIAAQWYWRADGEPELVQRYIAYWLCVEALELGDNANIVPVLARVAELLGVDRSAVKASVGRMYGIRSDLVHGKIRDVTPEAVERLSSLAIALLESRSLKVVSGPRLEALRSAVTRGDS